MDHLLPPRSRSDADRAWVRIPASTLRSTATTAWLVITCSWTNVLFPCLALALCVEVQEHHGLGVFVVNYLALLSALGLFRYASEVLSAKIHAVSRRSWEAACIAFTLDLEVVLIALCRGQLELVKGFIVGKTITTLFVTVGTCFIVGGVRRGEHHFDAWMANTLTSLLFTAVAPQGMISLFPPGLDHAPPPLTLSRGASVVLLALYLLYLVFRKKTHPRMFDHVEDHVVREPHLDCLASDVPRIHTVHVFVAVGIVLATICAGYRCGHNIVDFTKREHGPSEIIVGFCLLPLLAELAEMPRILRFAANDNMGIALEVASTVGIQTALLLAPLLCLIGAVVGQPLDLSLNILEGTSLLLCVWNYGYLIQDGKSNYIKGFMGVGLYLVIALAFFLCE